MGRFLQKLANLGKKAGRFVGRIAGKVGNVAGVLANVPIVGRVASTVARVANIASKVGNGIANGIERIQEKKAKYQPVIDKVKDAARAVHRTGIPDKMTGGAVSRVINRGREIRDRADRKLDKVAGAAGRIGQRIEAGVNKAGGIVQQVVR